MPTFHADERFWREYSRLSAAQQLTFLRAVRQLVATLQSGSFPPALRIKRFRGSADWWELTWAPDGRALFRYGDEVRSGHPHIIWLRVGKHDIFRPE
ncbi:MAG: hypothetical protein WD557_11125 [Dehalococcoidia bacterium]